MMEDKFDSLDQGQTPYANDNPLSLEFGIQRIVILDVMIVRIVLILWFCFIILLIILVIILCFVILKILWFWQALNSLPDCYFLKPLRYLWACEFLDGIKRWESISWLSGIPHQKKFSKMSLKTTALLIQLFSWKAVLHVLAFSLR